MDKVFGNPAASALKISAAGIFKEVFLRIRNNGVTTIRAAVSTLALLKKKIMKNHTKHLSFLFMVPLEFMSPAVRVVTQYEIKVRYTLDYRGMVTLEDYNVKPGMAQHIVKWNELEAQMLQAAENNARQFPIRVEYETLHGNRN